MAPHKLHVFVPAHQDSLQRRATHWRWWPPCVDPNVRYNTILTNAAIDVEFFPLLHEHIFLVLIFLAQVAMGFILNLIPRNSSAQHKATTHSLRTKGHSTNIPLLIQLLQDTVRLHLNKIRNAVVPNLWRGRLMNYGHQRTYEGHSPSEHLLLCHRANDALMG